MKTGKESNITTDQILPLLQQLNGYEFEEFVSDLWSFRGWETEVTSQSGDKGIDIIATKSFPYPKKTLIQTKRYGTDSSVSGPELQKYASLKQRDSVDEVIVITTSRFTNQARSLAQEFNIKLVNGDTLSELVVEMSAEELVESYVDDRREETIQIEENTPTVPTDHKPSSSLNIVDECDLFRAKLLGYEYIKTSQAKIRRPKEFKGYFLAMELTNLSKYDLSIHPWSDLSIYGDDGFTYNPKKKFAKDRYFPGNWQVNIPVISAQSKARFATYIEAPSETSITKIRYKRRTQTVFKDYRFPDDFPQQERERRRDTHERTQRDAISV
ncbi:restriction endonuclease [Haladaptatus paucihalophilus DX253]|uniref:Restriction endonuclease n=1 Tax=Haladaptatus paucihalophilus DX253 TaxID=797209 RepID=E7QWS1_HALPU|nr:restriction endonuclease [Haladaptatus paucihalophilus]EFW91167.1 restriction endonuclease [Haladaptatus paucihalophilus DX253]SHL35255.1 Restriction endonuclease [Haladaptatus paucihalophilus DX253]